MAASVKYVVFGAAFLVAAACLVLPQSAHAAVLGIDFGSEFVKASMVKPGKPFYIVLDEHSKRKYPAMVGFDDNERFFGNGATSLATRKPDRTFAYAHWALGKGIDAPEIQRYKDQYYPYEILPTPRGTVAFKYNDSLAFSAEELVAMTLQNVKRLAEADAEMEITDCVITVPIFFTQKERAALLDAATLAGFNVLGLINENTAVALQYAIDRDYVANQQSLVVFYNQGTTATTATLVRYVGRLVGDAKKNKTIGTFEVVDSAWDSFVGGQNIDMAIFRKFLADLNALLKKKLGDKAPDMTKNAKVMAKLRALSRKTKEILSANAHTPAFIESVYQEIDFRSQLTRDEMNELLGDFYQAALRPLQTLFENNNLSAENVDAVVMVGGSTRVPKLQQVLKEFFKKDLSYNLNADEAATMGAAFHAANVSTQFRVRQLEMNDVFPFPVGVRFTDLPQAAQTAAAASDDSESGDAAVDAEDGDAESSQGSSSTSSSASASSSSAPKAKALSKRASLYRRNNAVNKRKTVTFAHPRDLQVRLHYDSAASLPTGVSPQLGYYNITGVEAVVADPANARFAANETVPLITATFLLNKNGMVALTKAEASFDEMVQVEVTTKAKEPAQKAKADKKEGDKEGTDAAAADADKEKESEKEKDDKEKADSANADSGVERQLVWKKKTLTFPLTISEGPAPDISSMSDKEMNAARGLLYRLNRQDQTKKEIAQAKNSVESFIYDTRPKLEEADIVAVSTQSQRDELSALLDESVNWLSEQSDDSATPFIDRLASMRKLADPIFFRAAEAKRRPAAVNATLTVLNYTKTASAKMRAERPWVKNTSLDELDSLIEAAESWITKKIAEQQTRLPHETPAFTADEMANRLKAAAAKAADLMKLKKPVKKTKPKQNATANSNNTSAANQTSASSSSSGSSEGSGDAEAETEPVKPADTAAKAAAEGSEGADESGAAAGSDSAEPHIHEDL